MLRKKITERVENEESLKSGAVVGQFPVGIKNH